MAGIDLSGVELPAYCGVWTVGAVDVAHGECMQSPLATSSVPPTLVGGSDSHDGQDSVVSVHWLTGSVPADRSFALVRYVAAMVGAKPTIREWGRFRYDCSACWETEGICLYFDSTESRSQEVHGGRACLMVPGSALDSLDGEGLGQLLADLLYRFWFRASRIDVAWDDYERRITPGQVWEYCRAGDVSGFQLITPHQDHRVVSGAAVLESDSLAFGRRGSDGSGKFLRVYDKAMESDGEQNCIRWEVEYSGDRAAEVFRRLASASSLPELGAFLGALVGGCVSFIRRAEGDKNLARCPVHEWWQEIVALLGRVSVRRPKRLATVEQSQAWVARQVSGTLAVLRSALGSEGFREWLEPLLDWRTDTMRETDQARVESYLRQNEREVVGFFERVAL